MSEVQKVGSAKAHCCRLHSEVIAAAAVHSSTPDTHAAAAFEALLRRGGRSAFVDSI